MDSGSGDEVQAPSASTQRSQPGWGGLQSNVSIVSIVSIDTHGDVVKSSTTDAPRAEGRFHLSVSQDNVEQEENSSTSLGAEAVEPQVGM